MAKRRPQQETIPFSFGYIDEAPAWRMPTTLPNYAGEPNIGLDIETYDPSLLDTGAGHVFDSGCVLGVAVALSKDECGYYPVKNEFHDGFDKAEIVEWLYRCFTKDTRMIGHSLLYDTGWLEHDGFKHTGTFFDVQFAEALLNEHRNSYTLDYIALEHGFEGKQSTALYDWCAHRFGGPPDQRQRRNIYRAPVRLVGPYAEADAWLPLAIMEKQLPLLEQDGLMPLCDMEQALMPILNAMRRRGVRVDMKARSVLQSRISNEDIEQTALIKKIAGRTLNVDAPSEIAAVFDKNGWEYPLTENAKQPSFTKDWLLAHPEPFANAIAKARRLRKLQKTFVTGYFDMAHKGRVHATVHPLRTGENGTVSGRPSTTKPNTANIPSRDPVYGPLIRGLFLPEDGEEWVCLDYQQAELRVLAHYAVGRGSKELRSRYTNDRTLDFHTEMQRTTGFSRYAAKTIVFSVCYGAGVANTATLLKCSEDEARTFRDEFFAANPFIKATFDECEYRATTRGWIKTLKGRRARFPHWEASDFDLANELGVYDTKEECMKMVLRETGIDVPNSRLVKRARTYKALNALLQGSVADFMKQAMLDLWRSGVCDVLGAPLITVYDELDWSKPKTKEGDEAIAEAANIMAGAIKLRVPMVVDTEKGSSWGSLS